MSRKPFAIAALALVSLVALAPSLTRAETEDAKPTAAGSYKVDGVHSAAIWNIQHAGVGTSWGRVNDAAGTFKVADDGSLASVEITLDLTKIDTANAKRDEHLKGPDFFNVKQFPTMTFKSTSIKKGDAGGFEVTGDLTIKGTTKSINVTLTKTGENEAPQLGHRVGYDTSFTLARADYGVDYMPGMLGKDVKVFISLEGVKE